MNHFVKLIAQNAYMLEVAVLEGIMVCILLVAIFGKKKNTWVFPVVLAMWMVVCDIGLLIVLEDVWGGYLWFPGVRAILSFIANCAVLIITAVAWEEKLPKFMLGFMVVNFVAALLVMAPTAAGVTPPLSFLCAALIFAVFYKVSYPLLIKYRTYRLKHPVLIFTFIMVYMVNGVSSYFYYEGADSLKSPAAKTVRIAVQYGAVSIVTLLLVLLYCSIKNVRMQKRLLKDRELIEKYYDRVREEIGKLHDFRRQSEEKMDRVKDLLDSTLPENNTKPGGQSYELERYLSDLKARYDSLGEIFFCDDYMVDGILTDFVRSCREENIETDVLFQNYHPGGVKTEDVLGVLFLLMDSGKEYVQKDGKISLHAGVVKNQLIFTMTASLAVPTGDGGTGFARENANVGSQTENVRYKIRKWKRRFKKYLKKYDGSIRITELEGEWQVIVGLERE